MNGEETRSFLRRVIDSINPRPWGLPDRAIFAGIILFGVLNLVAITLVLVVK